MSASFETVAAAAEAMRNCPHPWWVAGGWAIDLFVGRVTRAHGDIEIGAFRDTQAALHEHLRRFKLFQAVEHEFIAWEAGHEIVPPVFQIQATGESLPGGELQAFLDDRIDGRWICRRNPSITLPIEELTSAAQGVRFLRPEIQLLFKAKHYALPKNEQDFSLVAPLLSAEQRTWLKDLIAATHPAHPWIARL